MLQSVGSQSLTPLSDCAKQKCTLFCNSFYPQLQYSMGFPGGAGGKEPACECSRGERLGSSPWVGSSAGGGHGSSLQCSCLEKPVDRGAWRATVQRSQRVGHD